MFVWFSARCIKLIKNYNNNKLYFSKVYTILYYSKDMFFIHFYNNIKQQKQFSTDNNDNHY